MRTLHADFRDRKVIMKAVLQRVKRSSVIVDGETVGACENGLMILLGVAAGDTEEDANLLAAKILNVKIKFESAVISSRFSAKICRAK